MHYTSYSTLYPAFLTTYSISPSHQLFVGDMAELLYIENVYTDVETTLNVENMTAKYLILKMLHSLFNHFPCGSFKVFFLL